MTLSDWVQLYLLTNTFAVIFYSTYAVPASPLYGDKLKALLGLVLTAWFGVLLVIAHKVKGGTNNG
jgi:hypothetical protein